MSDSDSIQWREQAHLWVAGAVTLLVVALHVVAYTQTTGLYRDEASGVAVATQATWAQLWELLEFESFGLFWFGLLRGWCALASSSDDALLRLLGLTDALLVLGAMWFAARRVGAGAPVMALSLTALHPAVLRWCGTLRGYGLGAVLIVLLFALVWQVVREPRPRRVAAMAVVALLAVHTVYYNAVLFFAIGVASMAVCSRYRQWRRAALIGGVGLLCAASMLPYLDVVRRAGEWNALVRIDVDQPFFIEGFAFALNLARPWFAYVWIGVAAGVFVLAWIPDQQDITAGRRDLRMFAGLSLVIGWVGFYVFMKSLGYPVWAPYYVVIMVFTGVCLDGLTARWWSVKGGPAAAAIVMIAMTVACAPPAWQYVRSRLTNIDQLAAVLTREATDRDLIVVHHWSAGVTFDRYYRGVAPWQTVPPLADHRVHRYDQFLVATREDDALAPLRSQIDGTLASGGSVWILRRGGEPFWPPPPEGPDPPQPVGENLYPYQVAWKARFDQTILRSAQQVGQLELPRISAVMRSEDFYLAVARGWATQSPPSAPSP